MAYDYSRLIAAGITFEHACQLRRISITLHRWQELECGNSNDYVSYCLVRGKRTGNDFEYDDNGKPYMEYHRHTSNRPSYSPVPDRERGALKRLAAIMANYPGLMAYVQGDCRGAALYIGENLTNTDYSRGIAVYQ